MLKQYSLFQLIEESFSLIIEKSIKDFIKLEPQKICIITHDIFGKYQEVLNCTLHKYFWKKIVRLLVQQYFVRLFANKNANLGKIDDLRNKLRNDISTFIGFFSEKITKEKCKKILKNLELILEFLEISVHMISLSCQALKDFNGDSFNITNAKSLISLRTDLSEEEKNAALEICREVFQKWQLSHYKPNNIGNQISSNSLNFNENLRKKKASILDVWSHQANIEKEINDNAHLNHNVEEKKDKTKDKDDLLSLLVNEQNLKKIITRNQHKRLSVQHCLEYGIELSESYQKVDNYDNEINSIINEKDNHLQYSNAISSSNKKLDSSNPGINVISESHNKPKIHNIYHASSIIIEGELSKRTYGM